MKLSLKDNRKRIVAWICAVVVVFGGVGTTFYVRSKKNAQNNTPETNNFSMNNNKSDNDIISSGGTVESQQLCDYLGFESTNLKLTVDAVYVESGETITKGTAIYKLTDDSLEKAEKTLTTELQSAESTLLNQKMQYTKDQNDAYALYQSELLLGDTASSNLDNNLSSLDSDLQEAYNAYIEAKNTVENTPSEISRKQSEMSEKESEWNQYQELSNSAQEESNQKKEVYHSALQSYNAIVSEYNASAGTVQFLGKALGMDVSDVKLANTVQSLQEKKTDSDGGQQQEQGTPDFGSSGFSNTMPNMSNMSSSIPTFSREPAEEMPTEAEQNDNQDALMTLYETARSEYEQKKSELSSAETSYRNAESEYNSVQDTLNEYNNSMKEAQNSVSSLSNEIKSLQSQLSQAQSQLSGLLSTYNNLASSYDENKIDLQQTYESNLASGSNAEYNYQITLSTIEAELETAQSAYDTAEENLRIYHELLSDGIIKSQQDGMIYTVTYEAGNSMNINSPLIYYVNQETYTTTVEVDQYNVTKINIGDEVTIYSSETGMEQGVITAITKGETTSLADVNFNVTITANEDSNLYPGESVNVYFNASGMSGFSFEDAQNSENSANGESDGKPNFSGSFSGSGGELPEGFDPSNMPQGGNFPSFGGRKEE